MGSGIKLPAASGIGAVARYRVTGSVTVGPKRYRVTGSVTVGPKRYRVTGASTDPIDSTDART